MDNYTRLKYHIDEYLERKERAWAKSALDRERKSHLADCLVRWRANFHDTFLRDERFLNIAEPFTPETVVDPCQYYMRADGSIVFTEVTLADTEGQLIGGHPLRFPYDAAATGEYHSNNIEPDIFGMPMKCTTRVMRDGRKNYALQTEDCQRIITYQRNSRTPLMPLYFHDQHVGGETCRIVQTPIFRRDNFVVYFPFRRALDYMYKTLKFEPIVRGTDWLLQESHKLEFSRHAPLRYENLGVTGSSAFGDMNDKEDFDVVFLDKIENLRLIRDFLYAGVERGAFQSVSPARRLRVEHHGIPIACNANKPLILCTFQNLADATQDMLYGSRFNILGKIERLEATVIDDSENMITPPRVKLGGFSSPEGETGRQVHEGMYLIPMMGSCRGAYSNGMRLAIRDALVVEFAPRHGNNFTALVSVGWYDIDKL